MEGDFINCTSITEEREREPLVPDSPDGGKKGNQQQRGMPGTSSQLIQTLLLFLVVCVEHAHPAQESQQHTGSNREQGKVTHVKQTVKLYTGVREEHFTKQFIKMGRG